MNLHPYIQGVKDAGLWAVIAPQMGKQVVAFQAAMKVMADQFPGAFKGYTLTVTESHQTSKADTSGTAKAIVESFNDLGCDFDISVRAEVQVQHIRLTSILTPPSVESTCVVNFLKVYRDFERLVFKLT